MRSRSPKHLHPILGRRMVDWVLEAAPAARPRSARRRRRRPTPPAPSRTWRSPCRSARWARATRCVGAGEHWATPTTVLVLSGDTPLLTQRVLDGLAATPIAARRLPRRPCSRSCPTTPKLRPVLRDGDGDLDRDRRGIATRRPTSSPCARSNSSIYVFRADALWPALDAAEPAQRAGRALPDRRRSRSSSRTASASRCT